MSLKNDGVNQKVYRDVLTRIQDRAAKIRAADPLHRQVTFNETLTWMLDQLDKADQQEAHDA